MVVTPSFWSNCKKAGVMFAMLFGSVELYSASQVVLTVEPRLEWDA